MNKLAPFLVLLFIASFLIPPTIAIAQEGKWYYEMPVRWWHRLEPCDDSPVLEAYRIFDMAIHYSDPARRGDSWYFDFPTRWWHRLETLPEDRLEPRDEATEAYDQKKHPAKKKWDDDDYFDFPTRWWQRIEAPPKDRPDPRASARGAYSKNSTHPLLHGNPFYFDCPIRWWYCLETPPLPVRDPVPRKRWEEHIDHDVAIAFYALHFPCPEHEFLLLHITDDYTLEDLDFFLFKLELLFNPDP